VILVCAARAEIQRMLFLLCCGFDGGVFAGLASKGCSLRVGMNNEWSRLAGKAVAYRRRRTLSAGSRNSIARILVEPKNGYIDPGGS
jgi:hypothetical protein